MPGAEACRSPGGQDTRKANPCPLGTSLEMPAPRGRPHGRAPGRDCGGDLTLWQGSRIRRWRLGLKALGRSSEEALQTQLGKTEAQWGRICEAAGGPSGLHQRSLRARHSRGPCWLGWASWCAPPHTGPASAWGQAAPGVGAGRHCLVPCYQTGWRSPPEPKPVPTRQWCPPLPVTQQSLSR